MFSFRVGNREFHQGKLVRELEIDLGLSEGFTVSLFNQTDWECVLKLAALAEASLNRLLSQRLTISGFAADEAPVELGRWIERHSVQGAVGKLELVKKTGLLHRQSADELKCLFDVRNRYAHRITSASRPALEIYEEIGSRRLDLFEANEKNKAFEGVDRGPLFKLCLVLSTYSALSWTEFNRKPPGLLDWLEEV